MTPQYQPPQDWFCPKCGFDNLSFHQQCSKCQSMNPYAQWQQQPQPQVIHVVNQLPLKSRAAYIILGLFLGGLGIHNFYAGHNGRGIAQLLLTLFTAWLCFPIILIWGWIIIEVIVTTTDGYGRKLV